MRQFWSVLVLSILFLSCDKGLEPPPPSSLATISGTITYVGTFPPCDSVVLLAVVLATPPEPYTELQLFVGLNTEFFYSELDKCTFRDTTFSFTVKAGRYNYLGVAHNYDNPLKDWQVVGFAHTASDSARVFDLKGGDNITGVNIRVRFDSLPRQPFIQ